jgi:lipopolysaccharide transport system ATP-binding protein
MHPAIRVENLSKHYRLGERLRGYKTLRESLVEAVQAPFKRFANPKSEIRNPKSNDFWALKDVSFEVQPGEVVGIIGRNGAGKSTLLKILSRITEPTSGRIELRGRVGSLLEVGTGFHPELTGRENIYMNGSILGMNRAEIRKKFDEMVAFAEIEKFLDTPVKRYSSGMYVRLAFAIAAHLEPEILIVDEVLAVGDATFQRRCLDRMSYLAHSGATVLLVSHNLQIMPTLCKHAILLEGGRVAMAGDADQVIDGYIASHLDANGDDLTVMKHHGTGRARFTHMNLLREDGSPVHTHVSGEDLIVRMEIESSSAVRDVALAVVLMNLRGLRVLTSWTKEAGFRVDIQPGRQWIDCRFRGVRLRPGHQVTVMLWMATTNETLDVVENVQTLQVVSSPCDRHFSTNSDQGIVLCDHSWSYASGV